MAETKKVVLVFTNYGEELVKGSGSTTGFYLPEAAHPHHVFKEAGFDIVYASPRGGVAPCDQGSVEAFKGDELCTSFLPVIQQLETVRLDSLKADDFQILFVVGGHGPLFDLTDDSALAKLGSVIHANGGVIGSVCHGVCGILSMTAADGKPLAAGKSVTSFTNAEEAAVNLTEAVPYLLETRLREVGASFVAADNWANHVESDTRVVTGQNPASATSTAEKSIEALSA
jgi:putative intracellular protease/amidase